MPEHPPIHVGSIYIWEIDAPHACELLKVTEVTWNGDEWMIRTEPLHPSLVNTTYPRLAAGYWNDLSRFREATTLVRDVAGGGGTEKASPPLLTGTPGRERRDGATVDLELYADDPEYAAEVDAKAGGGTACCDLHGRNCEPPSELCCEDCTEADHPGHRNWGPCSNPDLAGGGGTPSLAAALRASLASARDRARSGGGTEDGGE